MPKLEKVIEGLEACNRISGYGSDCQNCPYYDDEDASELPFGVCNIRDMLADALTLLKEREARVMEFSEIASFDGVVYLEDIDKIDVIRAICNGYIVNYDLLSFSSIRGAPVGSVEDYNKRWRAWTARPTDEQRKAVKWDGGT